MSTPPRAIELALSSGRLRAHRFGPDDGRLVVCVHGLSANSRSYDFLGPELAARGRSVVALDLRGRGWSDVTGLGTYGWRNHARDVLEAATQLGAQRFEYVGHSMGAFVGLEVARQAPARLERAVLIDAVGIPEPASLLPILAAVQRLGSVHPSADAYVDAVRRLGIISPWSPVWETHYRYDLVAVDGGVRPRTDRAAVFEDMTYGATQSPRSFWPDLTMPALLVRAAVPLGDGYIVSARDRADFLHEVPRSEAVDVDANHYAVMTHPATAAAIRSFLP
ncbi:MAG: alpha/beta hydrolase fold protein [Myxococcaceae bacterium]|nr:alpha/beta hydrolase fold protein [Myxococcaceae bacterium]